jgi:hypothetical protein
LATAQTKAPATSRHRDNGRRTIAIRLESALCLGGIGSGFPNQRDFDSTCRLGGGQPE